MKSPLFGHLSGNPRSADGRGENTPGRACREDGMSGAKESEQRHQIGGAGKMQEIAAQIGVEQEMVNLGLRGGAAFPDIALQKHPPDQGIEPRIDPMLKPMSLDLVR